MPLGFRRHPIHGLPFDAPVRNTLRQEYERMPRGKRAALLRKALQRELLLWLTGQSRRRVACAQAQAQRVLWIYNWTTLGDSLMDLAVRQALPPTLQLDLYIAPALAPLYDGDVHLNHVYTRIEDCTGPYDFVLLQDLTTASLRLKRRCAPRAPFATVFEHLRGEHFDRLSFAQRRFEQLFHLSPTAPRQPLLALGPRSEAAGTRTRIAVALGARDPRRWYRRWPDVLQHLLRCWPADRPAPEFVLIGNNNAHDDLSAFPQTLLDSHCRIEIGRHDLRGTAELIRDCDAFLGIDGGLMHLAVACGRPGLAVFVEIDPALRLLPGTRLQSLFSEQPIDALPPQQLAERLLEALKP